MTNAINSTDIYSNGTVTSNETEQEPVDEILHLYQITVPCLVIMGIIAFCMNAYILRLSAFVRRPMSTMVILTLSLAAADCWASTVFSVGFILNSYLTIVLEITIPEQLCIILVHEALRLGGMFTSAFHLLWLALNHYITIAYGISKKRHLSRRVLYILVISAWCIPPVFYLIWFLIAGLTGTTHEFETTDSCNLSFMHEISYRAPVVSFLLLLLTMMAVLYILMFFSLTELEKQVQHTRKSKQLRRRRRTLVTTLWMVGSFCVAWLPSSTMFVLSARPWVDTIFDNSSSTKIVLNICVNSLILLKFLINPLIYTLRIPEYQEVLGVACGRKRVKALGPISYTGVTANRPSLNLMSSGSADHLDDGATEAKSVLNAKTCKISFGERWTLALRRLASTDSTISRSQTPSTFLTVPGNSIYGNHRTRVNANAMNIEDDMSSFVID